MLILTCPYCGCDKDETELSAGGEAHLKRFGPGATDEEFEGYLFRSGQSQRLAFRALALCLWMRKMVSCRPLHRHAGGFWNL